jgi:hypothetical protein
MSSSDINNLLLRSTEIYVRDHRAAGTQDDGKASALVRVAVSGMVRPFPLECDDYLMDGRWADTEMALEVGLGKRASKQTV